MRISPVLFLLPVLVLTGSAAIANDDRPVSPQPAIAAHVAAPLTIESLAGTYGGVVDEKALKEEAKSWLNDYKKQGIRGITVEQVELGASNGWGSRGSARVSDRQTKDQIAH